MSNSLDFNRFYSYEELINKSNDLLDTLEFSYNQGWCSNLFYNYLLDNISNRKTSSIDDYNKYVKSNVHF